MGAHRTPQSLAPQTAHGMLHSSHIPYLWCSSPAQLVLILQNSAKTSSPPTNCPSVLKCQLLAPLVASAKISHKYHLYIYCFHCLFYKRIIFIPERTKKGTCSRNSRNLFRASKRDCTNVFPWDMDLGLESDRVSNFLYILDSIR